MLLIEPAVADHVTAVLEVPLTVAVALVNRFTNAVESRTRKTEKSPMGISTPPMRKFTGTFQPRSPLYL